MPAHRPTAASPHDAEAHWHRCGVKPMGLGANRDGCGRWWPHAALVCTAEAVARCPQCWDAREGGDG